MEFRVFLEDADGDVQKTLAKLPKKHRALVDGYKFIFQPGNTLKGDHEHIGVTDEEKKTITVCAPWFYAREMTTLHEVAHKVWATLSPEQREQWAKIVKSTKMEKKDRQNPEELFCMAYGAVYAKHPPLTYRHDKWMNFVKKLS